MSHLCLVATASVITVVWLCFVIPEPVLPSIDGFESPDTIDPFAPKQGNLTRLGNRTWYFTEPKEPFFGKVKDYNESLNKIIFIDGSQEGKEESTYKFSDLSDRDREFAKRHESGQESGWVVGVVDGDTLYVLTDSKIRLKIRLHGIDAPEKSQDYGQKAKDHLSELTYRKPVWLNIHSKDRDRDVATVYLDDRRSREGMVNRMMVEAGFAWHSAKFLQSDEFAAAESAAKEKRLGLWGGSRRPVPPWNWRKGSHPPSEKYSESRFYPKNAGVNRLGFNHPPAIAQKVMYELWARDELTALRHRTTGKIHLCGLGCRSVKHTSPAKLETCSPDAKGEICKDCRRIKEWLRARRNR